MFASTAGLLAIGGLYGALSYVVTQRSRDIGVRLVLGVSGRTIRRPGLRQGMAPAMAGLAAGLDASMIASRVIASMLFGVTPRDLATYVTVVVLVVAGALVACLLPARRAASVKPAVILRAR